MQYLKFFMGLALITIIVTLGIGTINIDLGENVHYAYVGIPASLLLILLFATPYLIRMRNLFASEGQILTSLLDIFKKHPQLSNVKRLEDAIWCGIRSAMPEYVHMRKSFYLSVDVKTFQLYSLFSTIRYLNEDQNAITTKDAVDEAVHLLEELVKDCQTLTNQKSNTGLSSFQIAFGLRLSEDALEYVDNLLYLKRHLAA